MKLAGDGGSLFASNHLVSYKACNDMRNSIRKRRGRLRIRPFIWMGLCGFLILLQEIVPLAKEKEPDSFALLAGSCFNSDGFSLPGASIRVEMQTNQEKPGKTKKWQTVSDARGEFALRLPAGRHIFLIKASREGFVPLETTVSFVQDERQDIILKFHLGSSKEK
jgi:hypothetical protein